MALDPKVHKFVPLCLLVLAIIAVGSTPTESQRHERHISTVDPPDQTIHHRSSQTIGHPNAKSTNFPIDVTQPSPSWKVSHRLVGGHMRSEVKVESPYAESDDDDVDDDEAKWDDGLILSSAGNGKEKPNPQKTDDGDKKTLAQQVKEGKYGLIQNEIYPTKPKRPGIISYLSNPDVPRDNAKNLGGLDDDDIWLAENHVLVLRGGNFPDHDSERRNDEKKFAWPPIDDYEAPKRQVKIPPRPKVPPPFPVQLADNAPLQIIGVNGSVPVVENPDDASSAKTGFLPGEGPFFPTSPNRTTIHENSTINANEHDPSNDNRKKTKSNDVTSTGLIGPFFPSLPPGAVFVLPPGNRSDYDEDDQSIYYPPPYSFYYKQDNTSAVPPGPLVPGIILPPPPDFFARQEEKKPVAKVQYSKYGKRPTTTPVPRIRTTVNASKKPIAKIRKETILEPSTTVKPQVTPHQALYYFYEEAKDESDAVTPNPVAKYRTTTQKPVHRITDDSRKSEKSKKSRYESVNRVTTTPMTVKNFKVQLLESTPKIPLPHRQTTNFPDNQRQSYSKRYPEITTSKPIAFDEWQDYRDNINNEKQYSYDETETQSEQDIQPQRETILDYRDQTSISYPTSSTHRSLTTKTTANPQHAYYTKQDEQLLDDVTKQFFNNFGKKLRGESLPNTTPIYGDAVGVTRRPDYSDVESYDTNDYDDDRQTVTLKTNRIRVHYGDQTRRPYSLNDDVRVNYNDPLPTHDPDAEWITEFNSKRPINVPNDNDERNYQKDSLPPIDSTVEWITRLRSQQRDNVNPQTNSQLYYKDPVTPSNRDSDWIVRLNSKLRTESPIRESVDYNKESLEPIEPSNKWIPRLNSKQPVDVSLGDDIGINYREPRPSVDPDSEWIPGYGPKQPINVPLQNYRNQQIRLSNENYVQRNLTSQRLATIVDYNGREIVRQPVNGRTTNYVASVGDSTRNSDDDDPTDYNDGQRENVNVNYPTRSKPIANNYNANYHVRTKSLGHPITDNYPARPLYIVDDGNYHTRQESSLADDVNVNYRNPRPPINPNAEFIDPIGIRENAAEKGPYRSFAYRLPGDGGHFYFLTPHPNNQPQDRNGGYLYPRPRGPRLSRRRKRGPDNV